VNSSNTPNLPALRADAWLGSPRRGPPSHPADQCRCPIPYIRGDGNTGCGGEWPHQLGRARSVPEPSPFRDHETRLTRQLGSLVLLIIGAGQPCGPQLTLSRWHPASVPRQSRTVLARRRSRCGYDLRSPPSGTADVRSGKLGMQRSWVVPHPCQVAEHPRCPAGTVGPGSGRSSCPASRGLRRRECRARLDALEAVIRTVDNPKGSFRSHRCRVPGSTEQ
jgi:hypothetical protein